MGERQYPEWAYWIPYGPGLWYALGRYPNKVAYRVNAILKFVEFDCMTTDKPYWLIAAETALPALGEAILTLLAFDWDDVARGFLRPYGLRSRRRSRRSGNRKKRRFAFEIPEIGELIGEHLPGAKAMKSSKAMKGLRFLWKIDMALQRILYYWMLFDVGLDFFYHWSTGIMTSTACYHGRHGGLACSSDFLGAYAPADWTPVGCPPPPLGKMETWGDTPIHSGGFGSDKHQFQVCFSANWRKVFTVEEPAVEFGLLDYHNPAIIHDRTGEVLTQPGKDNSVISFGRFEAGTRVVPAYRATGKGTIAFTDVSILIAH